MREEAGRQVRKLLEESRRVAKGAWARMESGQVMESDWIENPF